jgi:hypothetical protein
MKKKLTALIVAALLLSSCGNDNAAMTTTDAAAAGAATTTSATTTTSAATTTTAAATEAETDADEKQEESGTEAGGDTKGDFDAKLITTKDRWTRLYLKEGEEDRNSYWPYITVEYNREKDYVAFTMDYLGSNIYMSVDSADLVPIDGEYWIQDFGNADGSPPELSKAYMKYTPEQITIYYWSEIDQAFDWDAPQYFNFTEEF